VYWPPETKIQTVKKMFIVVPIKYSYAAE